jgi:hypothetical protein
VNRVAVCLLAAVLAAAGCGRSKEHRIVERARKDFVNPARKTAADLMREQYGLKFDFPEPYDRRFNNCTVSECKIVDYVKTPLGGPEYWAVEVEFRGKDVVTNYVEEGVAVLIYTNVLVAEGKRDDFLVTVMTGTTDDDIRDIRKSTEDWFKTFKSVL